VSTKLSNMTHTGRHKRVEAYTAFVYITIYNVIINQLTEIHTTSQPTNYS